MVRKTVLQLLLRAGIGFLLLVLSLNIPTRATQTDDQASQTIITPSQPLGISIFTHLQMMNGQSAFEKKDIAALKRFYNERSFKSIWFKWRRPTRASQAMFKVFRQAPTYGLSASLFINEHMSLPVDGSATNDQIARADIALSLSALAYIRHAMGGVIEDFSEISDTITVKPQRPDPYETLRRLLSVSDPSGLMQAYHPSHSEFLRLRAKLIELLRQKETADHPQISLDGGALKLGKRDVRVVQLRKRLDVPGTTSDEQLFDESVLSAVKNYQKSKGLTVDGIVGQGTLSSLNGQSNTVLKKQIALAMEQWRWLPRNLGNFHVFVNVPSYLLEVRDSGRLAHQTRVVVGKTKNKTPIFSDEIEYLVVNPFWNVPKSIAIKEIIPEIQKDIQYFERNSIQMVDYQGNLIDPTTYDWMTADASSFPYRFRQIPGEGNALGKIKFIFPNAHAVYLHDTPSKSLFSHKRRAYSHGCVRVQNPMEFASALLAYDQNLTSEKVASYFGGQEKYLNLSSHVPVHLTYMTLRIDQEGHISRYKDVYGYNKLISKKLRLDML